MRVPLRTGRAFDAQEPPDTVIVSETLARRVFGGDAVGKRIVFTATRNQPPREIVGVVGDEHLGPLDEPTRPTMYVPHSRSGAASVALVVRGSVQGDALARAVGEVDRAIPVFGIATMDERIARQPWMFARRFPALLVGAFAGLALALAAIGIYGVLSYTVRQRTHEIGIRRAVGAQGRHIVGLLLGHTALLAVAGVTIGLGLALATTRLLGSLLFGISPSDPITLGGSAALLLAVALAASWLPARWAMAVDPLEAMR
jgi:putative ABC transport system permease protein